MNDKNPADTRVLVALSGGVDSSVAALLLTQAGYDVEAATLRMLDCVSGPGAKSCCGVSSMALSRKVARKLGIVHHILDCRETFERKVLRYSYDEYITGRTPNPCVMCNKYVKFGFLLDWALRNGFDYIASGHHARLETLEGPPGGRLRERRAGREMGDKTAFLLKGADAHKDQSYFLFALDERQLTRLMLPIGGLSKERVRRIAAGAGLPSASSGESTDVCFLREGSEGFADSLCGLFGGEPGPGLMRDESGRILGRHRGIHRYTVGQRRGLGIGTGKRLWVLGIDHCRNEVIVTGDEKRLMAESVRLDKLHWTGGQAPGTAAADPVCVDVKLRYRHRPAAATLYSEGEQARIEFEEPQRAPTPGQAAVFYDGERVIGGGWIAGTLFQNPPHALMNTNTGCGSV